ncbi:hypothetical protein BDW74DRAFT_157947 [Aspergillus multicolor]|uniref:putative C2H2 finger domain protein n=1 Tax=Aspergillus multicolor TaxID=41759 RepID=UPI003CCD2D90
MSHAWGDSILQGISATPTGELSPIEPTADLSPGGSTLGYQLAAAPVLLSQHHGPLFTQWLPPLQQSASPSPQPLDHSQYSSARFLNDQDSWTPLRITGVPANVTFSTRPLGVVQETGEFDRRCSAEQYSESSETGSQYNGLHSSDSGYSTRSCATQSISTSNVVDSAYSPHLDPQDYDGDEKMALLDISSAQLCEPPGISGQLQTPSSIINEVVRCNYPKCPWTGKCPSDKRKHEARHKKLFKCDLPNCTRKEGFGTINDLARHKKCVHKKEPERGPKILYMCFGRNCPRSNKKWPRLDNFRQHLARMHNTEDGEELLERSREWYERVRSENTVSTLVDKVPAGAKSQPVQSITEPKTLIRAADCDSQDPLVAIRSAIRAADSDMLMLNPTREHDMFHATDIQSQSMELSALTALELEPALAHSMRNPSKCANSRHDKMDNMISEAAVSVINAMTKMIHNHRRRRGCMGEDDIAEDSELSDRNRDILQKILVAASELLSETPGTRDGISHE